MLFLELEFYGNKKEHPSGHNHHNYNSVLRFFPQGVDLLNPGWSPESPDGQFK